MMKSLQGVRDGMKSIGDSSLQTKAAILGTFYAIDRMTRFAGNMGSSLYSFSKITGMSAKELQKWQHAGRQVNITNEEVASGFQNVQKTMGDMLIGKGAPEGLAILSDSVGFDPSQANNAIYVMQKLQEFALSFKGDISTANTVLRSFGVGDGMIAAFRQMAFTSEKMAQAQVLSDGDIQRLSKMNAQLSEIYNGFKIMMAQVLSKFMPEIINFVKVFSNEISKMLGRFGESKEFLKGIKAIIDGIAWAITKSITGLGMIIESVARVSDFFSGKGILEGSKDLGGSILEGLKEFVKGVTMSDNDFLPSKQGVTTSSSSSVNVRNEINITSDLSNPREVSSDIQRALNGTFWQMNQGAVK